MLDDKKIEEVARRYSKVTDCDKEEALLIEEGFKEGAKWAINELLKDLWHPANEIPKEFNHYGFAALYILQYNCQIRMVLYDKNYMSWKNVIGINECWLYVDDLLPKKGGEKRKRINTH